jgi:hypothetical protein
MEFVLNETLIKSLNKELSKRKNRVEEGTTTTASRPREAVFFDLIPIQIVPSAIQKEFWAESKSSKKALVIDKTTAAAAGQQVRAGRWSQTKEKTLDGDKRVAAISSSSRRTIVFWISPNPKEYLYGIACFCKASDLSSIPGLEENPDSKLFITDILGWDKKEAVKVKRTTYVKYEKLVTRAEIEAIDEKIALKIEQLKERVRLEVEQANQSLGGLVVEPPAKAGNIITDSQRLLNVLRAHTPSSSGSYQLYHDFFFPVNFSYLTEPTYRSFTKLYTCWEQYGKGQLFTKIRKTESSPIKYLETGFFKLLCNVSSFSGKHLFSIAAQKLTKYFVIEEEIKEYSPKNEQGVTLLSSEWMVKCVFPKISVEYINKILDNEVRQLQLKLKVLLKEESAEYSRMPYGGRSSISKSNLEREITSLQVNRPKAEELKALQGFLKMLSSKCFRKYYQSIFDEANKLILLSFTEVELGEKTNTIGVKDAIISWCSAVFSTISLCIQILRIWPDCPIDLLANNLERLTALSKIEPCTRLLPSVKGEARLLDWVHKNIKPATYFSILNSLELEGLSVKDSYSHQGMFYVGNNLPLPTNSKGQTVELLKRIGGMQLVDTFDMLSTVLSSVSKAEDLAPPPRWRISTFHDYIMKKSWEVKGPGELLPKVLLKEAINLKAESGTKWSFTQPNCSNELAWWGKTVRNCVGSSGYVDSVKKKTRFIIFCFLDDKPCITVNLKLERGSLVVQEIRQPSNQSLDNKTNTEFQTLFSQVLEIITQQNQTKSEHNPKGTNQTQIN